MNTILALIDLTDDADAVADAAGKFAAALNAPVVLLHVSTPDADYEGDRLRENYSRDGIAAELARSRRRLRALATDLVSRGLRATPLLARSTSSRGNPIGKIRQEVARLRPDLIVAGASRHGLLHRLLISTVTDALMRAPPCPLLVIPAAHP